MMQAKELKALLERLKSEKLTRFEPVTFHNFALRTLRRRDVLAKIRAGLLNLARINQVIANSSNLGLSSDELLEITTIKQQLIREKNNLQKSQSVACRRCGGDGGADNRCSHCGGNGIEPGAA